MSYVALITGTVLILLFTWFSSLKYKRWHGIPRLFAFVSIYILFLLNINLWFHDPFSMNQILSWILLAVSVYTALAGFILLIRQGSPVNNFENTTVLVRSGIYGYIRHPLYLSLILLGTGVMMKDPQLLQLFLGLINIVSLYFTAKLEEKEMIMKFGNAYLGYMKETKMFIPYVI